MISLYECVHEIQKATGWSQGQISIETGLHLSTINRVFRLPIYRGNKTSKKLITQLHREVVTSPFPEYLEQLFYFYDVWKERWSKRDFTEYLDTLEPLLKQHNSLYTQELAACRVCWLIGHIYFDRAFYLKRDTFKMVDSALDWYQEALKRLDYHLNNNLQVQKYKIQQCIVSIHFNCCKPKQRANNEDIRCWLLDMDYLKVVEKVIKEDPWNWIVARNGLIAASILRDLEKCWFFWKAMKKVNKRFADLDFVPSCDLPAIKEDVDLTWFVEQVVIRR